MPGPFDDLAKAFGVSPEAVNDHAAMDFMAQRRRLREVRARMIEEQERPTAYRVEHTDKDGNVIGETAAGGPFQIGRIRDTNPVPPKERDGFRVVFPMDPPEKPGEAVADLDRIDELLAEVEMFQAPGIYRESPHPEIREGEEYGDYVSRVASEYERQTGEDAVRRPIPDSDSVRESSADHPDSERGTLAIGTGTSGQARPDVCGGGETGTDDIGDSEQRSGSANTDATGDAGADATGPVPSS